MRKKLRMGGKKSGFKIIYNFLFFQDTIAKNILKEKIK